MRIKRMWMYRLYGLLKSIFLIPAYGFKGVTKFIVWDKDWQKRNKK